MSLSHHPIVSARASMRTALWCWLTKMAAQAVVCVPFVGFMIYICPEGVPTLLLRLFFYSASLAAISTAVTMMGRVEASEDGVRFPIFGRSKFIPWDEIGFGNSLFFCLEKPHVIVSKRTGDKILIWPSMNGFSELKTLFARRGISLDRRIVSASEQQFRPFDEVLGDLK